jgi:hypothetical protein
MRSKSMMILRRLNCSGHSQTSIVNSVVELFRGGLAEYGDGVRVRGLHLLFS